MVLMNMDAYDEMFGRLEIYRALAKSEEEIAAGKYRDAGAVLAEMKSNYAL